MRRGCTSLGNIKCDECQRIILHPERYLCIDEEDGTDKRLCMDCCLSKGLAKEQTTKEGTEITFLPSK
jgi:hypothetical protein